jgi:hypothetical protein
MTIEELGVRLKELETTCSTVSDELDATRPRAERLEGLEQVRDALMEFPSWSSTPGRCRRS